MNDPVETSQPITSASQKAAHQFISLIDMSPLGIIHLVRLQNFRRNYYFLPFDIGIHARSLN